MIKSKKQMYIVISVFTLILLLGTTTYAFFNYTRTGVSNVIRVGRISFNSSQNGNINLTNVFPITSTDAETDTTNAKSVSITIAGDTDYSAGVEYLVSASDVNMTVNGKQLPVSLEVTVAGNNNKTLGTLETGNYYTNRDNYSVNKYKIEYDGELEENAHILVGYIAPNTTSGTAEGVDGTVTIKAYIDSSKVAISDTYPEGTIRTVITTGYSSSDCETVLTGVTNASTYCATASSLQAAIDNANLTSVQISSLVSTGIVEEYTDGTTSSWVQGRTVFTTNEWNSIQSAQTPLSFKVKVEANEGMWVENPNTLVSIMKRSTQLDTGIDFTQPSSYNNNSNGQGIYTLSSTANATNPIMYYRGEVENNNVYFAGYCWQIVRTTETGGVKLIYNGVNTGTSQEPKCESTGTGTQLSGTYQYSGNGLYKSLAYDGYTWGTVYEWTQGAPSSNAKFGTTFTHDENGYKISAGENGTIATGYQNGCHYTCNSSDANATCNEIRYYHYTDYYLTLTNGDGIEDVITKMRTTGVKANDTSSLAKQTLDTWYSTNMTGYTNMLEDTIWCNDRSISFLGSFDESGTTTGYLFFYAYDRLTDGTPSLTCRDQVDKYTVSSANGNGMLDYPVGLITSDEISLAGGTLSVGNVNDPYYLNTGQKYWTMSPSFVGINVTYNHNMDENGKAINNYTSYSGGLRPMVSLKSGTEVNSGSGLKTDPYVIE